MRPIAASTALLLVGLLAGCSNSSESCNDISGKICGRLVECQSMDSVFSSEQQCVDSFNGLFEVNGSDAAACVDTWSAVTDLDCEAFLDYFQI